MYTCTCVKGQQITGCRGLCPYEGHESGGIDVVLKKSLTPLIPAGSSDSINKKNNNSNNNNNNSCSI